MGHRKLLWAGAALAASVGYVLRRAPQGAVRGADAVQRLYDRVAPAYDAAAWAFRPLGARRLQEQAVDLLDLHPGDTVVDLGCGTGVNLPALANAVGEHGHVVGVDLSSGMLVRARRRADRHRLSQVTLHRADIRGFRLPRRDGRGPGDRIARDGPRARRCGARAGPATRTHPRQARRGRCPPATDVARVGGHARPHRHCGVRCHPRLRGHPALAIGAPPHGRDHVRNSRRRGSLPDRRPPQACPERRPRG